jgi:hypothetical protein
VAVLVAQIYVGDALAQSDTGLSGSWTITWDNNSKNPMSLKLTNERFSGTYTNDSKESCPVSGNLDSTSKRLALQVACPQWDMRMEGQVVPDMIKGTYRAGVSGTGKFTMAKQTK